MNACLIIDYVTRPFLCSSAPNDEGSKLCAADGWIDEGWKHVPVHFRSCLAKSSVFFTPIIAHFGRSLMLFGLGFSRTNKS